MTETESVSSAKALFIFLIKTSHTTICRTDLGPVYMEWGNPVWWGWFLLFSRSGGHKTKETYPTRPGSPTPCKQGLNVRIEKG